ncbi:MAG: D-TA family PLP-dependent enzyme [Bacteroidota bacterium]
MNLGWQIITNNEAFDTPLVAIYKERVEDNIKVALEMVDGDPGRLRPHIKTHKTGEIITLFLKYGIYKIKCATIAEAELAATNGITDVLLAYQPAGKKIERLISLIKGFPKVNFSCLIDNLQSAQQISIKAVQSNLTAVNVFIDLNTGMNRTGYPYNNQLAAFYTQVNSITSINLKGIHIYDGHLDGLDDVLRAKPAELALQTIYGECAEIAGMGLNYPLLIAGGSNTFSFYAQQQNIECSPGTFVFWDINYLSKLPELKFKLAAVLVVTVISKPADNMLCLDLGYKSVSSESPINSRIFFPWNMDLVPVSQSEEHLVVQCKNDTTYQIGDRLYAIPNHICPSIALYDELNVVVNNEIVAQWEVIARRRRLCL